MKLVYTLAIATGLSLGMSFELFRQYALRSIEAAQADQQWGHCEGLLDKATRMLPKRSQWRLRQLIERDGG